MHPDTRMEHSSALHLTNGSMGLSLLNGYHPQLHLREEAALSLAHSNSAASSPLDYDGDAEDLIETIVIEVFKCKECRFYTSDKLTVLEHVRQVHCGRSARQVGLVGSPSEGSEVTSEMDCNPMDLSAKKHVAGKTGDREASAYPTPLCSTSVTTGVSTVRQTCPKIQGELSRVSEETQGLKGFSEVKIKKEKEDCDPPCACSQTCQDGKTRGCPQTSEHASIPVVNRPTSLNDSLRSIKTEPQDDMELCRIDKWPFVSYEPVRKDGAPSPIQPPSGNLSPADSEPRMSPDSSQDQARRVHAASPGRDSPSHFPHHNGSEHSGTDSEMDVPSEEEEMDVFCLSGNGAIIPGLPARLDTMSEGSLPQFHPVLRKELEKHSGMATLRTREGFVKKIHLMHMVQKDAGKGGGSDDVVPRIARTVSMATDAAMEESQSETQQSEGAEWLTKETSWIEYKCPKCDRRSFKTAEDLEFHLKCHSDQGGYKCIYCGHATNIWSTLKQHVYSKHCLDKPFKCQHCSYQAASKQLLKAHRLRHLTVGGDRVSKDYTCSICNFTCSWGPGFLQHMKVHGGLKSCFHCGFVTSNSAVLYRHIVKNHNSSKPNKNPETPFTTSNANLLALHANKHTTSGKESLSEATVVSPGCKNVIRYSKYICQICGDSYEGQQELIQHVVTNHPGKQLLFCEQCKYTTRRRDHMEKHLQSGATADVTDSGCAMKCKLCGRIDKDRDAMEAHIRTAHLTELQSVEALIQSANSASNSQAMTPQDNIKTDVLAATSSSTSLSSGGSTSTSPSHVATSAEDSYQALQVTASRDLPGNAGTIMTFRAAKPNPPAITPVIGGMPYYSVQLRDRANSEPGNDFHGFLKFKVNKETKQRLKQAAKTRQKEQPEDFANMQMKFKLQGAGHKRRGRKPSQGFQKLVQEEIF